MMVAPHFSIPAEDTISAATVGQPPAPPMRPTGRDSHTAVWTGSEMIVWGGIEGLPGFKHWREIRSRQR